MDLHGQVLAGAERAADPGQGDPHLLRRQAQARRDLVPVDVEPLGGHEQVHPAVVRGHGQAGLRAERRLVLHADLVLAGDHDLRPRPVGRAGLRADRPHPDRLVADEVAPRVHGGARRVERRPPGVGDRLPRLVLHPDRRGRPPRGLRVVGGDQRDRLPLVAHLVDGEDRLVLALQPVELLARHVLVGEHRDHPRDGQGGPDVDGADPRRRVRAPQRDPPQHAVQPQIGGVRELAGHLERAVGPQHARADAGAPSGLSRHGSPSVVGRDAALPEVQQAPRAGPMGADHGMRAVSGLGACSILQIR